MEIDIEFYIHGVPKGNDVWGNAQDPLYSKDQVYLESFYRTSETDRIKFLVEIRDVYGVRYCYCTYLRYADVVGSENRDGSYFGMTIRINRYCSDIRGLYRLLEQIYNNYILGDILKESGTKVKYVESSLKNVNGKLVSVRFLVLKWFEEWFKSSSNYKIDFNDFNIPDKKSIYKVSLSDCTEGYISNILKKFGIVAISPFYNTIKENKLDEECKQEIEKITKAKDSEIDSLNTSLSKEKKHSTTLSLQIEELNKDRESLQRTIDALKNDKRHYETALNEGVKKVLHAAVSKAGEDVASPKIEGRKSFADKIVSIIQFILIVFITGLCSFFACNDLGVFKNKKGAETNNTNSTEVVKLQEEKKGLDNRIRELENDNVELKKKNEALEKQLAEKNDSKQQQPEALPVPRIDIQEFKKASDKFEVGKEYSISIKNLPETKGGEWKVENADIRQDDEKGCKILIKDGDKVNIKYLRDGEEIWSRSVDIKK